MAWMFPRRLFISYLHVELDTLSVRVMDVIAHQLPLWRALWKINYYGGYDGGYDGGCHCEFNIIPNGEGITRILEIRIVPLLYAVMIPLSSHYQRYGFREWDIFWIWCLSECLFALIMFLMLS